MQLKFFWFSCTRTLKLRNSFLFAYISLDFYWCVTQETFFRRAIFFIVFFFERSPRADDRWVRGGTSVFTLLPKTLHRFSVICYSAWTLIQIFCWQLTVVSKLNILPNFYLIKSPLSGALFLEAKTVFLKKYNLNVKSLGHPGIPFFSLTVRTWAAPV